MKIILTSHAANHLLRLAQGLQSKNALSRFYTIYPQFKLTPYQIDPKYVKSFQFLAASIFLLRKMKTALPEKLYSTLFDRYVALMLRFDKTESNIVQGNSGFCLETLRAAKQKGMKTIVDRACPHIDFQLNLLDQEVENLTGQKNAISKKHTLRQKMLLEYDLADSIIVPSTYSYNSFIAKGFSEKKLNLVPLMKEKNVTRAFLQKENKIFTVLAVGFSFYRKGFYYLLKAFHALNIKNIRLIIRTTVPKEFEYLLKHENILAINHHLSTPDLIRYYQECDVFCLPSIDEGFGMAAMEGMAAGKPIIVTHNVGMTDLITHQKEGFILPIRDVQAIRESILMLYENKALCEKMGEAAYHCEQQYSQAQYIQTIMNVYRNKCMVSEIPI
ncbi:MAG: glycosyl transferase group 1 [uncultured bacterium]|nr:MAG: glycosyl transferase group 1 [uncultured bacterium]